jgi:hypothetical protein
LIAKLHTINSSAASRSDDPRSVEQQATNTLLRQINVIFSSEFIERFQELNDGKNRVDHETGNIAKKFWQNVTLAYNDFEEVEEVINTGQLDTQHQFWEDVRQIKIDVSSREKIQQTTSDLLDILDVAVNLPETNTKRTLGEFLLLHASKGNEGVVKEILAKFGWRSLLPVPAQDPTSVLNNEKASAADAMAPLYFDEKLIVVNKANDPIIRDLIDENTFDLSDVDVMTPIVFKKRINLLFRIRRTMKDNMTVSGTHDSDPWNFVDIAMNKIPGGRRLPKVGVLYFYRRCEEFPDVDAAFQTFLDDSLKGSTIEVDHRSSTDSDERSSKKFKEEKDKKDAYSSITEMAHYSSQIYDELQRSNKKMEHFEQTKVDFEKRKVEIEEMKLEMEMAKMLGDMDRIKELAAKIRKHNDSL